MKILQCQLFYKSIFVDLQFTFSQIFVEFVIAKFSSLFLATSRPNISATKIFWPTILFVPLWSRNTAVWQHWRHGESRLWFCLFGLIPYAKVTQPRNYKLNIWMLPTACVKNFHWLIASFLDVDLSKDDQNWFSCTDKGVIVRFFAYS